MNIYLVKLAKCVKYNLSFLRKYSDNSKKPPWKILFFGTDDFSVYSLKLLCSEFKSGSLLNKLEIVTSKRGRYNPVRKFAEEHNFPVYDWPITISANSYHLGLVVSFGHLLPENIINKFPFGMLNVHASLLPRWRGAAPIIYALANGDTETGVTIMKIKPHHFDIGEIVAQSTVKISPDMKLPELHKILGELGATNLLKTLQDLPNNLENARPQSNENITYAKKVTPEFARIHWKEMPANQIYNLERALTGFLPITTLWQEIPVKLINTEVCKCTYENSASEVAGFIKYNKRTKQLVVLCANKTCISVNKIGISGKRIISATDFNNGYLKKQQIIERYFK